MTSDSAAHSEIQTSPPATRPSVAAHAHYPGLDTLRAAAILMVIPRHAREILGGAFFGPVLKQVFNWGWVGVDLFFVLSGFLIGSQLLQSQRRDGRVRFGRFYLKRTLRIMPSFYAVLALYFLWPAFREKPEIDPAWRFILYIMNYGRKGEAFSHAWSLCVEEHFYLVFPALVAICAWRPKIFWPGLLIAGALLGVALLRYYLWSVGAPFYPAVYRPSHTHLDGLTIGVALALLREARPNAWVRLTSRPRLLLFIGVLLVACGIYEGFPEPVSYVLSFSFVSLGFGAFVAAALTPGFWLSRLRFPGAATVAALAFTLYLTHKQMIHMAADIVDKDDRIATIGLSAMLIAAMSLALHHGVEKPFLRLRDRILSRRSDQRDVAVVG